MSDSVSREKVEHAKELLKLGLPVWLEDGKNLLDYITELKAETDRLREQVTQLERDKESWKDAYTRGNR